MAYKRRQWQAVVTASASGPEYSPIFAANGRHYASRMAANLLYTTADMDFAANHFRGPNYDAGVHEQHYRLVNPTVNQLLETMQQATKWLKDCRNDSEWDGGAILFCFAGHGQQGDGALVLSDGIISPSDFLGMLRRIALEASLPERLRFSIVLDSCHSAAFTTYVISEAFGQDSNLLVPFHVYASCMEDEFAYEESTLGHGVYTYCFSVREQTLDAIAAQALQPDNTFGPSLAIASGEIGCSLLTAGRQNPVFYWNGTGELEAAGTSFSIFNEDDSVDLASVRARLKIERDKLRAVVRRLHPHLSGPDNISDNQMRESIRETRNFLSKYGVGT